MKLFSYLEKAVNNIGVADIQSNDFYIIKIKYYDYDQKKEKKLEYKIAKDSTVPQLSQLINKETDYKMTISSNESDYKSQTKLYDIFKEKYIELDVSYNPEANIPYILSFKQNSNVLSDNYKS
jgi:hypothetical protein